jgi:hypothetical protein
MNFAFDPAFIQRVAGALLHFIWQGAAIAMIAAICLRMMSRRSAEARYLVSSFGLAGMLAAPVVSTVAAIATAQPVVSESQNSEQKVGLTGGVTGRVVDMATGKGRRIQFLVLCCDYSKAIGSPRGTPPPRLGTPFLPTISDDGSFVFPSVPPGNYYLSVGGFWREGNAITDPDVVPVSWALAVGANGVTGLQLDVTEGVEVQGTILDQTGRPVAASVQLRPKPADFAFNLIGPPMNTGGSGRLNEPPQFTPLTIRGGQFGLLIPRANPSLNGIQERILEKARSLVRSGTAGPDGRFAFQKVHPGTYVLEVKSGNLAVPGPEIQVGIAGLANVSFQVPAVRVTGRVIAPGGDRLPKLNYIRVVRSGSDTDIFYGFPDSEGHFSLVLIPGEYRVFTERLGTPVQSVSDGSSDIANTEFTVEGGRSPQIVVTLAP